MKMVVTLKSGAQIRVGVKEFTVRRTRGTGELLGLNYVYDDDPAGVTLNWLDMDQVTAVHTERDGGDASKDETGPAEIGQTA